MTQEATPRIEVRLSATRTCFLSNEPAFVFSLSLTLRGSKEPVSFLKDGFPGIEGFLPINSTGVVQCFDIESGEQLQIIRQGTDPSFLQLEPDRRSGVRFTTSSTPRPGEIPFDLSALQLNKKYKLSFKPRPLRRTSRAVDPKIPWNVINDTNAVIFQSLESQPKAPNVSVSFSAPSTFSLSRNPPFTFTLHFTTYPVPITVLTRRDEVQDIDSDIEIQDPKSGAILGPDLIDLCNEDPLGREDFLRINGTYTEHRALRIGEEYALRFRGTTWDWWSEDTVDEVLTYANYGGSSLGLGTTEKIQVPSGSELLFMVVE
ncbi:hypothetical protein BCR34DRAFT_627378 [Clohesyomyces aquaticus]|uniref:Uncharacterized protein n=1 Tax=Clohesyomyces aquaticus TaxID=1231657 RepID=A0A1Y1YYN0_9PLEO|nr:hypothetical protein BCR34DRAFT_627378 [Clohesyomyces aquaticus]